MLPLLATVRWSFHEWSTLPTIYLRIIHLNSYSLINFHFLCPCPLFSWWLISINSLKRSTWMCFSSIISFAAWFDNSSIAICVCRKQLLCKFFWPCVVYFYIINKVLAITPQIRLMTNLSPSPHKIRASMCIRITFDNKLTIIDDSFVLKADSYRSITFFLSPMTLHTHTSHTYHVWMDGYTLSNLRYEGFLFNFLIHVLSLFLYFYSNLNGLGHNLPKLATIMYN